MGLVLLGVALIAMKMFDIGFVAAWSWWVVLLPFPLATVWWAWSDMSGRTRRLQMDKLDQKKVERREKALEALGVNVSSHDRHKRKAAAAAKEAAMARRGSGAASASAQPREASAPTMRDPVLAAADQDDVPTAINTQVQGGRGDAAG